MVEKRALVIFLVLTFWVCVWVAIITIFADVVMGDDLRYVPGLGYTMEPYVPGQAFPAPAAQEQQERERTWEQLDEIEDSLRRIEEQGRELERLDRLRLRE